MKCHMIEFKTVLFILSVLFLSTECFSQGHKNLPSRDSLVIDNDGPSIPRHVTLTFDTTHIEIYLNNSLLAIVPSAFEKYIDVKRVVRKERTPSSLADGRKLLVTEYYFDSKKR